MILAIRPGMRIRLSVLAAIVLFCGRASAHESTLHAYRASLRAAQDDATGATASPPGATAQLTIRLVDAKTRKSVCGMVRIKLPDGTALPLAELTSRGTGLRQNHTAWQWYIVPEQATVAVPQAQLTIEAFRGLETELATRTLDLTKTDAATVDLRLVRFDDLARRGWHSGNTHLHLRNFTRAQADDYLRTLGWADAIELVFVSNLRRTSAEHSYISNEYTRESLNGLSGHGVWFDWGEEHRHNFGSGGEGFGHVMLLNIQKLIRPVSIGPGIMDAGHDSQPMRRGIEEARRQGGSAIWCHNALGLEDVPNWIAGRLDAQNIFDGGNHGSYEDTYYRYMDVGLSVPFSAGTDWFMFDFSRAYVRLEEPLTAPRWLEALSQGRSFITNGPFLDLLVDRNAPGDTIRLEEPGTVKVIGRASGRCDFGQLELVSGGEIVHRVRCRPLGGHFEAQMAHSLEVREPGWIALRIRGENQNALGNPLFAHSSAVYLEVAGKRVFKRNAAEVLLAEMRQAIPTIQEKAVFADDRQRDEVLEVYRQGIATLESRLDN